MASLREDCRHLAGGLDLQATRRAEGRRWPEAHRAALRVVQAGGIVTQSVACKWKRERACPFCGAPTETPAHRFYACPRWDADRQRLGAGFDRQSLARFLSPFTLVTGLMPTDRRLQLAQRSAEAAGFWPLPRVRFRPSR